MHLGLGFTQSDYVVRNYAPRAVLQPPPRAVITTDFDAQVWRKTAVDFRRIDVGAYRGCITAQKNCFICVALRPPFAALLSPALRSTEAITLTNAAVIRPRRFDSRESLLQPTVPPQQRKCHSSGAGQSRDSCEAEARFPAPRDTEEPSSRQAATSALGPTRK